MKRPRLGDVFEFDVGGRLAYFHFVGRDPDIGDIIRVSPELFESKPQTFEKSFERRTQLYFFSIAAFLKPPVLIRFAGSMALTTSDLEVGRFVQRFTRKDGTNVYTVWENGQRTTRHELTPEQESYPAPYVAISFAHLVDRLLKANGLPAVATKRPTPPITTFYFYAKTKEQAQSVASSLLDLGLTPDIREAKDEWALVLSGVVDTKNVPAYLDRMDEAAKQHDVLSDGLDAPVAT